jgi:hypothetical protein
MKSENRGLSCKKNILIPVMSLFMAIPFLFSSSFVFSQEQQDFPDDQAYSDNELENFVEAAFEIIPLQEESQLRMIDEIEDRRLTVERFSTILEVEQLGLEDPGITEEEKEAFEEALKAIQEIQFEYQQLIVETIEDKGMSISKYEEILARYQQDQELQERVDQIMEDKGYDD